MYRRVVAARVRAAWAQLQERNADAVLDQFAPAFEHRFAGEHALGGARHSRQSQEQWFARVFRLFPDIRFTVRDVLVGGWPWRTRAVAVVDVRLASQPGYTNIVIQQLELRWGRITRVENLEDTQALAGMLLRIAEGGNAEALAPPIEDRSPDAASSSTSPSPSADERALRV